MLLLQGLHCDSACLMSQYLVNRPTEDRILEEMNSAVELLYEKVRLGSMKFKFNIYLLQVFVTYLTGRKVEGGYNCCNSVCK